MWTTFVKFVEQIERFTTFIVLAILAMAAYIGGILAVGQRLWLDEIMTTLIAKLPTAKQIWAVCSTGADNQPPAYDFLLHETIRLFHNDALGIRVPSLAGYLVGAFGLYWFVKSMTGTRLYGLIALLFSLTSGAWSYATDGRPYGLMFGCASLAAIFWQRSPRSKTPVLWLIFFSIALAASLNLQYYSVLLFMPFALAEAFRMYSRRKLDIAFWIAWAVPFLALLPYLSLIKNNRVRTGIADAYFAKPNIFTALSLTADQFFSSCVVPVLLMGVIYLGFRWLESSNNNIEQPSFFRARETFLVESALVMGFVLTPIAGIALSKYGTHIFFPRYLIAWTFGCSALVAIAFSLACQRRLWPALVASLVFLPFAAHSFKSQLQEARWWKSAPAAKQILERIPQQALESSAPIVVPYIDEFMQLEYYADPALHQRIVYLSSEDLAKHYLRFTYHERMMMGAAPFFGTNVVSYGDFVKVHHSFYVYGGLNTPDWIVPQLLADGAQVQLLQGGIASPDGVFHVPFMQVNLPPR